METIEGMVFLILVYIRREKTRPAHYLQQQKNKPGQILHSRLFQKFIERGFLRSRIILHVPHMGWPCKLCNTVVP
ncbi:hypothetical protein F2P79_009702 [Pimephales promelas]|nr:hypothetical protein F2P79_009702 [Pimephales promelas]